MQAPTQNMRRNPRWSLGLGGSSILDNALAFSYYRTSLRLSALGISGTSPRTESTSPPIRRRRFRRAPRGESISIGVSSLGQPGSIVVVPDRHGRTPRLESDEREPSAQTDDSSTLGSMLDALEEESTVLTGDSIRKRLEEYRTSFATNGKVPMSDWATLRSTIASSFTVNQLSNYLAEYHKHSPSSERTSARWIPGTSSFAQTGTRGSNGIADRFAPSVGLKGKQLLAERVLRDCWQLSITEEAGQMDLFLPHPYIALLLNAQLFSFDELASLHGSSIDITISLGLVKITGTQENCESIREIIADATGRIQEKDAGIDHRLPADADSVLSSDFLEWLGKTHGVAYEQNALKVPTKILYLAENKRGAEEARRTLHLALHETSPTPIPFSTYLPASELANLYNHNPETNVSWFDRQKFWFRWAMSSVQATEAESHFTPFFDSHQTRLSDALLKLLRSSPTPDKYQGDVSVHESVTAAVGRCLFSRKPSFNDTALTAQELGRLGLPRTFATDIPRVSSFLESLTPVSSTDGVHAYNVRLIPSPRFADNAPELDVEIILDSRQSADHAEGDFHVRKINTVLGAKRVDYLLPENGLDLRFTRTIYRTLWEKTEDESSEHPSMVDDISRCLRDVFESSQTSTGPVSLPAFCHLALPSDNLAPAEAETSVEYILPPLNDVRGAATRQYDLDGRQLSYRFYESGPLLAHRTTEVSLGMDIPQSPLDVSQAGPADSLERNFHDFYIAACDMAFKIHKTRHVAADDE